MKIEDLKTGMIVKLRNKQTGTVLLGTANGDIIGGTYYGYLGRFYDDFKNKYDEEYDIMAIYQPSGNSRYLDYGYVINNCSPIWERKDNSQKIAELQIQLESIQAEIKKLKDEM